MCTAHGFVQLLLFDCSTSAPKNPTITLYSAYYISLYRNEYPSIDPTESTCLESILTEE